MILNIFGAAAAIFLLYDISTKTTRKKLPLILVKKYEKQLTEKQELCHDLMWVFLILSIGILYSSLVDSYFAATGINSDKFLYHISKAFIKLVLFHLGMAYSRAFSLIYRKGSTKDEPENKTPQ